MSSVILRFQKEERSVEVYLIAYNQQQKQYN